MVASGDNSNNDKDNGNKKKENGRREDMDRKIPAEQNQVAASASPETRKNITSNNKSVNRLSGGNTTFTPPRPSAILFKSKKSRRRVVSLDEMEQATAENNKTMGPQDSSRSNSSSKISCVTMLDDILLQEAANVGGSGTVAGRLRENLNLEEDYAFVHSVTAARRRRTLGLWRTERSVSCCGCGRPSSLSSSTLDPNSQYLLHTMLVRFPRGYVTAIMGPCHSGKSILLNFLADDCHEGGASNNHSHPNIQARGRVNLPGSKAYIPREDRLHGFYTCRSYMEHYVRLSGLSKTILHHHHDETHSVASSSTNNQTYKRDKSQHPQERNVQSRITQANSTRIHVDHILCSIGLRHQTDTTVGEVGGAGLTNGERKRLSIALEALSSPDNLFLDEPTSGLDTESVLQMMKFLRKYARGGRRVVIAVDQPGSFLWELIDHVVLLSKGKLMFQGPRSTMENFFAWAGHPTPLYYNPADHYVLAVNEECAQRQSRKKTPDEWASTYHQWLNGVIGSGISLEDPSYYSSDPDAHGQSESGSTSHQVAITLPETRSRRGEGRGAERTRNSDETALDDDDEPLTMPVFETARAGGFDTLLELTERYFACMLFNPGIFGTRVAMYVMLALVVGTLFWDIESLTTYTSIHTRVGLLFFCAAFFVFMSIAAIPFAILERTVVEKEVRNGYYHPAVYQVAQAVASIPGIFFLSFLTTSIFIGMTGMKQPYWYFLNMFLVLCCSEALTQLVSHLAPNFIVGMTIVAVIYGIFMLMQGYFRIPSEFPPGLRWTNKVAYHTYSWRTFMYSEFRNQQFPDAAPYGMGHGEDVLRLYEIQDVNPVSDMTALVLYALVLHLFSVCVLHVKMARPSVPKTTNGLSFGVQTRLAQAPCKQGRETSLSPLEKLEKPSSAVPVVSA